MSQKVTTPLKNYEAQKQTQTSDSFKKMNKLIVITSVMLLSVCDTCFLQEMSVFHNSKAYNVMIYHIRHQRSSMCAPHVNIDQIEMVEISHLSSQIQFGPSNLKTTF